jgi:hypothetical protein
MSHALRGIKAPTQRNAENTSLKLPTTYFDHRVFERATQLDPSIRHPRLHFIANGWRRWIETCLRANLHAERLTKCRDRPAWSPKPHQASMMVAFWKIKMSEIKNAVISVRNLKHSCDKLTTDSPPQASTFVEVCTKLRSAQTKLEPSENKPTNTDPNF